MKNSKQKKAEIALDVQLTDLDHVFLTAGA